MKVLLFLGSLILSIFGITFAILNAQPVAINYYLGAKMLPLSLLLALGLSIGALIGLVVGLGFCFKTQRSNFRLQRRIKLAEEEINNLRSIPIKDKH